MGKDEDNPHEVPDPLRLDRCPDCGYLLTGLPEQGICPECGFGYDREMIVLYGRRTAWGPAWGVLSQQGPPLDFLPIVPVMMIALAISLAASSGISSPIIIAAALLTPLIILAVFFWRRSIRQNVVAPVQMRLCRAGFATRRGIGPAKLQPWSGRHCVQIIPPLLARERPRSWHLCRVINAEILGVNLWPLTTRRSAFSARARQPHSCASDCGAGTCDRSDRAAAASAVQASVDDESNRYSLSKLACLVIGLVGHVWTHGLGGVRRFLTPFAGPTFRGVNSGPRCGAAGAGLSGTPHGRRRFTLAAPGMVPTLCKPACPVKN
jgi:hypothetical protein